MGGAYAFFKSASANLRQKDDTYNHAIGGFFSGSMLGLRCMFPSPARRDTPRRDGSETNGNRSPLGTSSSRIRHIACCHSCSIQLHRRSSSGRGTRPRGGRGCTERISAKEQAEEYRGDYQRAWRRKRYVLESMFYCHGSASRGVQQANKS